MQIIVLGMHRSGTSMVTRLINLMGAYTGEEDSLTGFNSENPKGFWERRDVRDANDFLLQENDFDWHIVSNFSPEKLSQPTVTKFNTQAKKIIHKLDGHRPWVIKEPRISLTLPIWENLLEVPIYIVCYRDPSEVAISLAVRNEFPSQFSLALYEYYTLSILNNTKNQPVLFIEHRDIIEDSVKCTKIIYDFLKANQVRRIYLPSEEEINAFIDKRLYRSKKEFGNNDINIGSAFDLYNSIKNKTNIDNIGNKIKSVSNRLIPYENKIHLATHQEQIKTQSKQLKDLVENNLKRLDIADDLRRTLISISSELKKNAAVSNNVEKRLKLIEDQIRVIGKLEICFFRIEQNLSFFERNIYQIESAINAIENNSVNTIITDVKNLDKKLISLEKILESATSRADKQDQLIKAQLDLEHKLDNLNKEKNEIIITNSDKESKYLKEIESLNKDLNQLRTKSESLQSKEINLKSDVKSVIDTIITRLNILEEHIQHTVESWRWKVGNIFISTIEKILLRNTPRLSISIINQEVRNLGKDVKTLENSLKELLSIAKPLVGNDSKANITYKINTKERIVIYSALVGNYDTITEPTCFPSNVDFILFTNQPQIKSSIWEVRPLSYFDSDPTRMARYIKTNPHAFLDAYDISIWIDANLQLVGNISNYINKITSSPDKIFALYKHPFRDSIEQEVNKCIEFNKDTSDILTDQLNHYKSNFRIPKKSLFETGFLIRRHNEKLCKKINTDWWSEIQNWSKRDQISLPIVLDKYGFTPTRLRNDSINLRNDPDIKYHHHNKAKNLVFENPQFSTPLRSKSNQTHLLNIKVSFGICVYNALEDVKKAIYSIIAVAEIHDEIIIINDFSNNETKEFLESLSLNEPRINIITNKKNLGYTKSANKFLKSATGDYFFLINSDVILSKNCRNKMLFWGESFPTCGIISPMSNAASWQTIPERFDENGKFLINSLPKGFSIEQFDKLCAATSSYQKLSIPLLNGFCLLIKSSVCQKIGYFDEKAFPQGYGEEDDFCIRSINAGFENLVATNVFVWHSKSKSFGSERKKVLSKQGMQNLIEKHSKYRIKHSIQNIINHPVLINFVRDISNSLQNKPNRVRHGIINIAIIIPSNSISSPHGSTFIRLIQELEGKENFEIFNFGNIKEIIEYNPSKIIIQRTNPNIDITQILQYAIINSIPISFEIDDNLFESKLATNELYRSNLYKLVFCSDNITTSTNQLSTFLAQYNKKVEIIENKISFNYWSNPSSKEKQLIATNRKFLYHGTYTHEEDLLLIYDVIMDLAIKYQHVEFHLIGVSKRINGFKNIKKVSPPSNKTLYPSFSKWLQSYSKPFSVGLAPLLDNSFNSYKSDLKFLEYTAMDLLSVCSNVTPYKVAKEQDLAIVVDNTYNDWFDAISKIIEQPKDFIEIKKRAKKYLYEKRAINK